MPDRAGYETVEHIQDADGDATFVEVDVADVVAFLCSADASSVTGHTIPVDGGQAAD